MIEATKQEINDALVCMRKAAEDKDVRAKMQTAWNTVCDELTPFYKAKRPVMKNFEVHHCNEVARMRFALSFKAGHDLNTCVKMSVAEIKGA